MILQPVILCGGSGTRLWPLSREHSPKQLLALNGERTLLQESALRLRGAECGVHAPLVVCNEEHRFLVAEQLRRVGAEPCAMLLEPCGRGTAPALTLAALHARTTGDAVLLAMPSDHVVKQPAAFRSAIEAGSAHARESYLVAFGVPPAGAETGYGYIRAGAALGAGAGAARRVERFVEKPGAEAARRFLAEGGYLWNSGIFAVRASLWLEHIGRLRGDILEACTRAHGAGSADGSFYRVAHGEFEACPSDSIDCAVMEKIASASPDGGALVVPLDAGWSDVGAWGALWEIETKDADGNAIHGDVHAIDTHNALLIAQHRLLACIGLQDVVVVETADAVMIASREQAQHVKAMVARLREAGRRECLDHRLVQRPWGSYDSIERGERFQVKHLTVQPGATLSLQMHHHRAEHWIVVRGTAKVQRGDESFLLSENQSTYIPLGVRHRLENPGRVPLEIIEVQSGSYLEEDDIVRFDDRYGRANAAPGG